MGIRNKIGNIDIRNVRPINWTAFWAGLISATVENAAPTKIIMTFSQANTSLLATDFTIAGKTITLLERDVTNKILTLTVSVAVIYGDVVVITFVKTGGIKAVINNVLYSMLLTKTGDGTGVSAITLTVSADMTITLGANAKFYSDVGGTLNESSSFTFLSGAARTRYIKCTTGTATMTFSNTTVTNFTIPWAANYLNQPSFSGDISKLSSLTILYCLAPNIFSGDISGLTSLTSLACAGSNILSGDLNPIVSDLIECYLISCAMVDYTSGATWGNTRVLINPVAGYGYDSTEIDNMLIDMAASVALISKAITLKGSSAARTAASNTAVATLEGAGRTCTVLTN